MRVGDMERLLAQPHQCGHAVGRGHRDFHFHQTAAGSVFRNAVLEKNGAAQCARGDDCRGKGGELGAPGRCLYAIEGGELGARATIIFVSSWRPSSVFLGCGVGSRVASAGADFTMASRAAGAAALPRGGATPFGFDSPPTTSAPRAAATVSRDRVDALHDMFHWRFQRRGY